MYKHTENQALVPQKLTVEYLDGTIFIDYYIHHEFYTPTALSLNNGHAIYYNIYDNKRHIKLIDCIISFNGVSLMYLSNHYPHIFYEKDWNKAKDKYAATKNNLEVFE